MHERKPLPLGRFLSLSKTYPNHHVLKLSSAIYTALHPTYPALSFCLFVFMHSTYSLLTYYILNLFIVHYLFPTSQNGKLLEHASLSLVIH